MLPVAPPSNAKSNDAISIVVKERLPAPAPESMSTLPPNVTAWVNTMLSSVVSMSPDVAILPEPLVMLTAPSAIIPANTPIVTALVPLPLMVTVPLFMVVRELSTRAIAP